MRKEKRKTAKASIERQLHEYIGKMKKYIHLLKAVVVEKQNEDGSFKIYELTNEETDIFPLRFFAIPRKGDIFFLEEVYYEVILVQFEVAKKSWPRPIYFAEGTIFLKEIGGKMEFREVLKKSIATV
ncbi:MAG TPA: hypothetical protein VF939_21225 [Puia sp.]